MNRGCSTGPGSARGSLPVLLLMLLLVTGFLACRTRST